MTTIIQTEEPQKKQKRSKIPEDFSKAHSIAILIRRLAWATIAVTLAIFVIWLAIWGRNEIETRVNEENTQADAYFYQADILLFDGS